MFRVRPHGGYGKAAARNGVVREYTDVGRYLMRELAGDGMTVVSTEDVRGTGRGGARRGAAWVGSVNDRVRFDEEWQELQEYERFVWASVVEDVRTGFAM